MQLVKQIGIAWLVQPTDPLPVAMVFIRSLFSCFVKQYVWAHSSLRLGSGLSRFVLPFCTFTVLLLISLNNTRCVVPGFALHNRSYRLTRQSAGGDSLVGLKKLWPRLDEKGIVVNLQ